MAFLASSQLFTFKLEDSAGEFSPSVSAAPVNVRLRELDWTNDNERDNTDSEYMTGTWFGADESIVGKKRVTANYTLKLAPGEFTPASVSAAPVDAGHKLNYAPLFENCGLSVIDIGTALTDDQEGLYVFYPDQSQSQKTMSIASVMYNGEEDTYQVAVGAGAMSNFTITADGTATPFMVAFETQARSEGVFDATGMTVATLDESDVMRTVADSMRNTTVTITDLETDVVTDLCITNMSFASNNEVSEIECQDTDSGLKSYIITKPAPTLGVDPLLETLAQFNWWEAVSSERFYKVEIESEFMKIFIPRAQINENSVTESNGFMRNELTFRALINIDGEYPTWLPIANVPANPTKIPYYMAIEESPKKY